jgi:hypothetical protein
LSPDPESGENYFGTYGEFYFGIDKDLLISEQPKPELFKSDNILRHHPRFFSPDLRPGEGKPRRLWSEIFRIPLILRRKPSSGTLRTGELMSQKIIKYPLLSKRRPAVNTVFPGGKRFFYDP